MKQLFLFLIVFLTISCSQKVLPPSPVVSINNQNFVYRGIDNKLQIAVPGAKSFKVTAPRLIDHGFGKYAWNVNQISGDTAILDFEIINERDSIFHDSKQYYVKPAPKLIIAINNRGCDKCIIEIRKEDIRNAKISVRSETYFDSRFENFFVEEYTIVLPEGYEYKVYQNMFSYSLEKMIIQYPAGTIFRIKDIKYRYPGYNPPKVELKFILVDNK